MKTRPGPGIQSLQPFLPAFQNLDLALWRLKLINISCPQNGPTPPRSSRNRRPDRGQNHSNRIPICLPFWICPLSLSLSLCWCCCIGIWTRDAQQNHQLFSGTGIQVRPFVANGIATRKKIETRWIYGQQLRRIFATSILYKNDFVLINEINIAMFFFFFCSRQYRVILFFTKTEKELSFYLLIWLKLYDGRPYN